MPALKYFTDFVIIQKDFMFLALVPRVLLMQNMPMIPLKKGFTIHEGDSL